MKLFSEAGARMTVPDPISAQTADVLRRFNDCFLRHDPAPLAQLIAEDCIIENTQPAPDGSRHVGRESCIALWSRIATTAGAWFEPEDIIATGERGVIFWRLRWGTDRAQSVRGVNLMRLRDGKIIEAKGYVKGP